MTAGLTLNKITAQKGITIAEAASRVADLGWTPSYVQEAMTFPTDYKISKTPRDPMRQVLRSYFPMQEEKDNRVYGALDAALRGDMFRNVEPRWVEWMKLFWRSSRSRKSRRRARWQWSVGWRPARNCAPGLPCRWSTSSGTRRFR